MCRQQGFKIDPKFKTKFYNQRITNKSNQLISQKQVLAISGKCAWCVAFQLGRLGLDYDDFLYERSDRTNSTWIIFPFDRMGDE